MCQRHAKLIKSKLILVLLILVVSVCFPFSVAHAAGNVAVLTNAGYLDSSGNYHIVGEVQNIGDTAVNFVQVTATYYNTNNNPIDTRFDLTMLYVIMPERKSPFEIALLDAAESAQVHNYSLSITFLQTSPLPIGVEITSQSSSVDSSGRMHITGGLKNIGTETLVNPKVVATFYNAESKVIAAAMSNIDPEIVGETNPNQTTPFEIILDAERTQYVSTYILTAESNQYSIIPEFHSLTQLLIILISSTIIILAARKKYLPQPKLSSSLS